MAAPLFLPPAASASGDEGSPHDDYRRTCGRCGKRDAYRGEELCERCHDEASEAIGRQLRAMHERADSDRVRAGVATLEALVARHKQTWGGNYEKARPTSTKGDA